MDFSALSAPLRWIIGQLRKSGSFVQWPAVRTGLIGLGAAWALVVLASTVTVDDGFLIPYLGTNGSAVFQVTTLAVLIWVFGFGLALSYAASRSFQAKAWVWPAGLIIVGGLGCAGWQQLQAAWRDWVLLQDGLRASLIVAGAAIAGAGLGAGVRVARRQPPLWFAAVLVVAPFLVITLKAGAVAHLLVLIWCFLVAEALGHLALQGLGKIAGSAAAFPDRPGVVSVGVGLSLLSLVVLGLGLVGLVAPALLIVFLLLLTALFQRRIRDVLGRLRDRDWRQPAGLSAMDWCGLLMLAGLFAMFWIAALGPEVGADALGARIAMPVAWLRAGRIVPLPEMMLSYGSAGAEMLYLLVMPLAGLAAARVVTFGVAVLLLASTWLDVFGSRRDRHLALWLFAFWGSTLVWWQFAWGFVDLVQMFFYYACILAVWVWLRESHPVYLGAAGVLGATATMVKLNGAGALAIAGIAVVGVTLYRTRSWRRVGTNLLWLAVPTFVTLLPWLARSYALTGNPVFPFANQLFRSPLASLDLVAVHFGVGLAFPAVLTVPWGVFFDPRQFGGLGTYHPFLLAMLPLALVGLIGSGASGGWWLAAGGLAGLSWLVTEQDIRYSLYAGFLLSLAVAVGLARLYATLVRKATRRLMLGWALAAVLVGFGVGVMRPLFWMWRDSAGPVLPTGVVLSGDSPAAYLSGKAGTYFCADWLNRHYGDRAKVWQVSVRDQLYVASPAFNQDHSIVPISQPLSELRRGARWRSDPAGIHQRLLELGYTHLMFDAASAVWSVEDNPDVATGVFSAAFQQRFLELECAYWGWRLYKVRAVEAPLPGRRSSAEPNLLRNPAFEILDFGGQPYNWTRTGQPQVIQAGQVTVHLDPGVLISQPVQVQENALYELDVTAATGRPDAAGYAQINWLDSAGQLLLFWQQAIPRSGSLRRYEFAQTAPPGSRAALVLLGGPAEVANVDFHELKTGQVGGVLAPARDSGGDVVYDFLKAAPTAAIIPDTPMETVSGKGAFLFDIDPLDQGQTRDSLVILPGVAVAYALTLPAAPARLSFDLGLPPGGDGADLEVLGSAGGPQMQLFWTLVEPGAPWRRVSVDLSRGAGQTVTLTFRAGAGPSGDGTMDWVALSDVKVVRSRR